MLITGVVVGWGLFVRVQRELVLSLRERAERVEAEQRQRVEQAREAERLRIAREMHDVLAHRVSLLSLHAGALEFHPDASAEEVAQAAAVIRSSAHAALEELRDVIGVLREGAPGDGPEPPQPTLAEIPALIEESRVAGMHVRWHIDVPGDAVLPAALGRAAYRIVQEGLTNARKHAPAAAVEVTITAEAGAASSWRSSAAGPSGSPRAPRSRSRARAPASSAWPSASRWPAASSSTGPTAPATSSCAPPCRGRRERRRPRPARRRRRARALGAADDAGRRGAIEVVGEADDGRGVLGAVDRHRPDVVLMDIRMPQLDGIAATRLLRAQPDAARGHRADHLRRRRARAARAARGAAGFLLKDTPPAEIVRAIELVHAGDGMLSPAVTRRLIALVAGDGDAAARHASAREQLPRSARASARSRSPSAAAAPTPRSPPSCT